jgi:hypothetical protein
MKTDDQYIQNIKRKYDKRKKTGYIILALAIFFCILSYNKYTTTIELTNNALIGLKFPSVGETVTETNVSSMKLSREVAQEMGKKIGYMRASLIFFIGIASFNILILFFGMRKEKLLINYYEKSKN